MPTYNELEPKPERGVVDQLADMGTDSARVRDLMETAAVVELEWCRENHVPLPSARAKMRDAAMRALEGRRFPSMRPKKTADKIVKRLLRGYKFAEHQASILTERDQARWDRDTRKGRC
jgi:hypothetical protein